MTYTIDLHEDYRFVLLTAALVCFHFLITGFFAGSMRSKLFSKDFMERNFKTEHERYFPGQDVPKGGYPDMGNGRYSQKLTYKEWFEFNTAQRIHYNYLEGVTGLVIWILVGGLAYPWVAVGLGSAHILGRIIFHVGYSLKGPQGRLVGAIFNAATNLGLMVLGILSPLKITGVI